MNLEHAECVRAAAHELQVRLGSARHDERAVSAAIDNCLAALNRLGLHGLENRLLSSELWNVAGHELARGWLQNRARTKPRGYAGDHELLDWIYHERVCDDPLGRHFDRYFQSQAAPQAVRNRMAMMADWISEAAAADPHLRLHVAIVGSAVGLEIHAALKQSRLSNLQVTLLDLDPASIEYAHVLLAERLPSERLIAQSANLFRLPERRQIAAPLAGANLILCPGLFDYLDDDAASQMFKALYEPLAPGGRLIVFQFAPHNPTRAYMEWFGNWYLVYRTRAEMEHILTASGIGDATIEYAAEPLGIDLFASLTKPL